LFLILFWNLGMVSQHLTAILVVCRYSVGQKNLYDKILNRSSHNKVLRQKLLFYLVVFEFLVNFSYNQSLFLWWYRVQIFTLLICTILSLENVSEKQDLCFHKFSEKSSKLTHHLAIDKLKTHPKIIEKQVCKKSKSAKKVCIFKKMQQKVCKNQKSKSSKKSAKTLEKLCKIKMFKSAYSKNEQKSAYSKNATTSLQNKNKASLQKSLHIQKWLRILFLISQAKNQLKSAYFKIIIFPSLEMNG